MFCNLFRRLSLDCSFSWSRTDCLAFGTTLDSSLCSVTTMLGVVGDPGADLVMSFSDFLGKTNGDNVHIDFRLCLTFPVTEISQKSQLTSVENNLSLSQSQSSVDSFKPIKTKQIVT